MLLSGYQYLLFLSAAAALVFAVPKRRHQILLLVALSYVFHATDAGTYAALLLFCSLLTFYCARMMGLDAPRRRLYLCLSVAVSVGALGYFKYTNFALKAASSLLGSLGVAAPAPVLSIVLPVGISFYTFQSLSYLFDVYSGRMKPVRSLADFLLLVCFFPHLNSGPILRAPDFLPQLAGRLRPTAPNLKFGVTLIAYGLVKKVVFADNIAGFAARVFENPASFSPAYSAFAALAYTIQVYCDFSGYTDIAIGSARVFGLSLPQNFNKPFFSTDPSDFWRRWHMSLSFWFRDYVFNPLYLVVSKAGGIRGLGLRARHLLSFTISIAVVELLLGLWHGANWNYVLFGAYYAVLIPAYYVNRAWWDRLPKAVRIPATFYLLVFGFIIFGLSDLEKLSACAWSLIKFTANPSPTEIYAVVSTNLYVAFLIALFAVLHYASYRLGDTIDRIRSLPDNLWFIFLAAEALFILLLVPSAGAGFIYYQF